MPRHSAEERSAAAWRSGSAHPAAPKYLSRDARKLWREVVEARPVDFFAPGSLQLLEQFCETMVTQRIALAEMARAAELNDPDRLAKATRVMKDLATVINNTAVKLRLSIQSALRTESRKNDERENVKSSLLGGGVINLKRPA